MKKSTIVTILFVLIAKNVWNAQKERVNILKDNGNYKGLYTKELRYTYGEITNK